LVNAYYEVRFNLIKVFASIVQSSLFDVNQPDYINYVIIGRTIGHELIHAFDNKGK